MAWRNQGITGSNNIPLGSRRRFGAGDSAPPDDGGYNPSQPSTGLSDGTYKRGRSPERGTASFGYHKDPGTDIFTAEVVGDGERRRKKRNRWGDAAENKAAGLMGLPTMIKANMTTEQLEAYTLHLRIQEISEKLRINDVVPADGDRYVHPRLQLGRIMLTLPLFAGPHLLRLSMTTLVVVSTLASTVTASVSKMSVTSRSKRP